MVEFHSIMCLLCELSYTFAHATADLSNDSLFPIIQQRDKIAITDELILIIMQKPANLLKTTKDVLYPMLQDLFRLDAQYLRNVAAVPHLHHICSLLHVLYLADFAENAEVLILQVLCQFMQGLPVVMQVDV